MRPFLQDNVESKKLLIKTFIRLFIYSLAYRYFFTYLFNIYSFCLQICREQHKFNNGGIQNFLKFKTARTSYELIPLIDYFIYIHFGLKVI